MTQVTDVQLVEYDRQGIIPGPNEDEESFVKRAAFCLNLKNFLIQKSESVLPFSSERTDSDFYFTKASSLSKIFDINPMWVPLYFSNYNLAPWHGGCAWIFQIDAQTPTSALLQLRKPMADKEHYLGLYDRNELIAHELCHVGRMMFEEPKFEEIIAYQTSSSWIRRFIAPLVQSASETLIFVAVLFFIFFLDIIFITTEQYGLYRSVQWLKILPLGLIFVAAMRLWNRYRQFFRCLKRLQPIVHGDARAVIFRLTDSEIEQFSSMSSDDISQSIAKNDSLRWRAIKKRMKIGAGAPVIL